LKYKKSDSNISSDFFIMLSPPKLSQHHYSAQDSKHYCRKEYVDMVL